MIIDDTIKKIFVGTDEIKKVMYQGVTVWPKIYNSNTELIFHGNSGTLDIDKLPKEYTAVIQGQTAKFYEDSNIIFQPMWSPYEDKHQFYSGSPTNYYGGTVPNMLSEYVEQAPRSYSINTGNLGGTLTTSIVGDGKQLKFTYTDTVMLSPYEDMPTKWVKLAFKL